MNKLPLFSGDDDLSFEGEGLVMMGAGGANGTSIQSEPEIYEKVLEILHSRYPVK